MSQTMGVFVSFSSKDRDQAELLISLLQFHGIQVWFSSKIRRTGTFPQPVIQAILRSDSLFVLVSENAASSRCVPSEVAIFLRARPGAPVLPIVIDGTKSSQIAKGLSEYPHFRFNFQGLEKAFASLQVNFLSKQRRTFQTRVQSDRRIAERRKSSPEYRLRKGLWLAYYEAKERDKFEPISASLYALIETREILLKEVTRYIYFSKQTNEQLEPEDVLRAASNVIWQKMGERPLGAIFVIEAIAAEICAHSQISPKDRRRSIDRRSTNRKAARSTG